MMELMIIGLLKTWTIIHIVGLTYITDGGRKYFKVLAILNIKDGMGQEKEAHYLQVPIFI